MKHYFSQDFSLDSAGMEKYARERVHDVVGKELIESMKVSNYDEPHLYAVKIYEDMEKRGQIYTSPYERMGSYKM